MKIKFVILSIFLLLLIIPIGVILKTKSFDPWMSDSAKIAEIDAYFMKNPMIENGASGFVNVDFERKNGILDEIKFNNYQYTKIYKDARFLGQDHKGNVQRFYFEHYAEYIIIKYVRWENPAKNKWENNGETRSYRIAKYGI